MQSGLLLAGGPALIAAAVMILTAVVRAATTMEIMIAIIIVLDATLAGFAMTMMKGVTGLAQRVFQDALRHAACLL